MEDSIFNTKADKRFKITGWILIMLVLISFILIIIAFIKGADWVTKQAQIATFLSEIAFQSLSLSIFLYIIATFILGSPKYIFYSVSKNTKFKIFIFSCLYYFGTFIQTLAYFIIGLPVAFLLIEKTPLTDSDIFLVLMTNLCIVLILDTIFFKLSYRFEKLFDKTVQKLKRGEESKLIEPEQELNKIYDLEKMYAIIATITTILVIGDAAGSIAFPLEVPKESNRLQAYLDSSSYIYMMLFVSTTLVYLKELVKGGIRRNKEKEG